MILTVGCAFGLPTARRDSAALRRLILYPFAETRMVVADSVIVVGNSTSGMENFEDSFLNTPFERIQRNWSAGILPAVSRRRKRWDELLGYWLVFYRRSRGSLGLVGLTHSLAFGLRYGLQHVVLFEDSRS